MKHKFKLVLLLTALFSAQAFAHSHYVDIYNTTPHDLKRFEQANTKMDWYFPELIKAGTSASVLIDYHDSAGVEISKDRADVMYSIGNTPELLVIEAKTDYESIWSYVFGDHVRYFYYYLYRKIEHEKTVHIFGGNVTTAKDAELKTNAHPYIVIVADPPECPTCPVPEKTESNTN